MSKLKKYLKSIVEGKAYKKACKKLVKNIAKECDNINLLADAGLSGVAGGMFDGCFKCCTKKNESEAGSPPQVHPQEPQMAVVPQPPRFRHLQPNAIKDSLLLYRNNMLKPGHLHGEGEGEDEGEGGGRSIGCSIF